MIKDDCIKVGYDMIKDDCSKFGYNVIKDYCIKVGYNVIKDGYISSDMTWLKIITLSSDITWTYGKGQSTHYTNHRLFEPRDIRCGFSQLSFSNFMHRVSN